MIPGTHVAVLGDRPGIGVEGRLLGLELRDTLLVLRPGPVAGFVFLFRVPLTENTVAAQVLTTGTGVLNIGECRISSKSTERVIHSGEQSPVTEAHDGYKRPGRSMYTHKPRERSGPANAHGRWPPNILLVHGPGCRHMGERRVQGHKGYPTGPGGSSSQLSQKGTPTTRMGAWEGHADADGLETIPAWECEMGCPVKLLDEQSGELTSGVYTGHRNMPKTLSVFGTFAIQDERPCSYGDAGGASRFYPQFSCEGELLEWLTVLLGGGVISRG